MCCILLTHRLVIWRTNQIIGHVFIPDNKGHCFITSLSKFHEILNVILTFCHEIYTLSVFYQATQLLQRLSLTSAMFGWGRGWTKICTSGWPYVNLNALCNFITLYVAGTFITFYSGRHGKGIMKVTNKWLSIFSLNLLIIQNGSIITTSKFIEILNILLEFTMSTTYELLEHQWVQMS